MTAPIEPDTLVTRRACHVSTQLNGETVLLHLETGKYFALNGVGAHVWAQLGTPALLSAVVASVQERFDVERERCERDVANLVAALHQAGFVELGS